MPTTLTVEDLIKLVDLARKAGGIDRIRQHLEALTRHEARRSPAATGEVGQPHPPTRLAG